MKQSFVIFAIIMSIFGCAQKKETTVGDVLAAMPKNDNQYQNVMINAGLQELSIGQSHIEVLDILQNSGQDFVTGNNWIVLQPVNSVGVQLAEELSIKFNEQQKIQFMILNVGKGLRFVVN